MNYDDALRRIEAVQAREGAEVHPLCRSELMTHGHTTPRAVVFLHGYTNCPRQFHDLGQACFERGCNVFIPRLPHHGLTHRLTPEVGRLTGQQLIDYVNEAVDIGRGLGRHLTLAGISAGGVAAAWAAQHRADLDQAVIIAPSFAISVLPSFLTPLFAQVASRLPAILIWWDPRARQHTTPAYAYPRFGTRSLAHVVRLGLGVRAAARKAKPLAGRILMVTNAADPAVDNRAARAIADAWQARGANVARYEFTADLRLLHDLIDPHQPAQRVDVVYPKLMALMGNCSGS